MNAQPKYNYALIALLCLVFSAWVFLFTGLYLYSKLGLILFVIITIVFLDKLGKAIPIKGLIGLIILLQMVVCPVIIYNYFDNDVQYSMDVDEYTYLNYVFIGIIGYLAGLFIPVGSKKIEIHKLINSMEVAQKQNGKIGIYLIITGYAVSLVKPIVPETLNFFVYLLENFKYIGALYILFSNNRYKYFWVFAVYGYLLYDTVGGGIFINLFIWGLLLFIFLSFKYRLKLINKLLLFTVAIYLAFFVQSFKKQYREVIWEDTKKTYVIKDDKSRQKIFIDMAAQKTEGTRELYQYSDLNNFVSRLNQGWILAKVLVHVPDHEPITNGETLKNDIWASIVPRILDPDKTVAGGEEGRKKFTRFTGRRLVKDTTMTIGIFGDAYVNFGFTGGIIFMFVFGFFLNLILVWIFNLSKTYPTLILWIPFIFFYTMRAGNDFVVILNFMTKSSLVVFLFFALYKRRLRVTVNQ